MVNSFIKSNKTKCREMKALILGLMVAFFAAITLGNAMFMGKIKYENTQNVRGADSCNEAVSWWSTLYFEDMPWQCQSDEDTDEFHFWLWEKWRC